MKSTTRTIAGGMLVLSLMHTTLASVPMNGTGQIEPASLEMLQAVEADGVLNGQDGQSVANMNDVVGGQAELSFRCWVCFGTAFVILPLVPPAGFAVGLGCALTCFNVF